VSEANRESSETPLKIRDQVAALQLLTKDLEQTNAQHDSDNYSARAQITTLKSQLAEARQHPNSVLQAEIASLKSQLTEARQESEKLRKENSKLKCSNAKAKLKAEAADALLQTAAKWRDRLAN